MAKYYEKMPPQTRQEIKKVIAARVQRMTQNRQRTFFTKDQK